MQSEGRSPIWATSDRAKQSVGDGLIGMAATPSTKLGWRFRD
ncbi:hypothetical protein K227x_50660 [Rubripirellula lacrimiformis]|uniref:Uncharacterized protein n=1 Tax=Rubripirellula lacrimiformis TaxID=1930273 RepID=A0A517NHP5_9BACT|nr:hypothetical protein [Rubripirellula lacrimiformis]QDT06650.1 hypothetical protein K227x_50660 [Rubripirellula lacrimiformis]